MEDTNTGGRGPRQRAAAANATTAETAEAGAAPREVKMPRAVHELRTGPDADDKIDGGTIITEKLAGEHGLDETDLEKLLDAGAIELVDVLVG